MRVPARNELTQDIPIVNNSQRDWNITVKLLKDNNKNGIYFSGPTEF